MANKRISDLPAAGALNGAELLEVSKSGASKQTTAQAIANLAPGGATTLTLLTSQGGGSAVAGSSSGVLLGSSFALPAGLLSPNGNATRFLRVRALVTFILSGTAADGGTFSVRLSDGTNLLGMLSLAIKIQAMSAGAVLQGNSGSYDCMVDFIVRYTSDTAVEYVAENQMFAHDGVLDGEQGRGTLRFATSSFVSAAAGGNLQINARNNVSVSSTVQLRMLTAEVVG